MDLSKIGKFIQEQRKAKNKNNQKIEPNWLVFFIVNYETFLELKEK